MSELSGPQIVAFKAQAVAWEQIACKSLNPSIAANFRYMADQLFNLVGVSERERERLLLDVY